VLEDLIRGSAAMKGPANPRKKTRPKLPGYARPHRRIQRVSNARAPIFRQPYVHSKSANVCSIRIEIEFTRPKRAALSAAGSEPRLIATVPLEAG
jgi:hypothetical protein